MQITHEVETLTLAESALYPIHLGCFCQPGNEKGKAGDKKVAIPEFSHVLKLIEPSAPPVHPHRSILTMKIVNVEHEDGAVYVVCLQG
jgi:hypothetical protein